MDSNSITITVTQAGGACTGQCLKVTAIDLSVSKGKVTSKVYVKDSTGKAMQSASASITWTKPGGVQVTATAVTNRSGVASFNITGGSGTYTITVNDVAKTGYSFDAANSICTKTITK
jgi:hypothetical protein